MPLTYSDYLKVDELLSLQKPLSEGPAHNETLFIIVHQAYELWFKEILHELDYLHELFINNDTPACLHTLKRIISVQKILIDHISALETMTPVEFLSFRDYLGSASGFQSFQFREIEFALGYKSQTSLLRFPEGSSARKRLEARYARPSLWSAFLHYLHQNRYHCPDELLNGDPTRSVEPSEHVRRVLLSVYENATILVNACELLMEMDEGFQDWRYKHVKMVERMIGDKPGTGGSSGVEYLKATLFKPFFPDLWLIRTELQKPW